MISPAYLLPLTRALAAMPTSQREAWAMWLARRSLARNGLRVRRAREHLSLSFPAWDDATHANCLLAHFVHRYRLLLGMGRLRYAPLEAITASIESWDGLDHLQAERAVGRGVIVATPHFGDWERFNLVMGTKVAATVLYKPSGDAVADAWLKQMRSRTGVVPVPVGAAGIRDVVMRLRQGGIVGILPDQVPRQGRGIAAPFLGRLAPTMNLIHRLVRATGCTVLYGSCHYHEQAYRLTLTPASPAIADADSVVSATALNQGVETVIEQAPEQYLWTYKRWEILG